LLARAPPVLSLLVSFPALPSFAETIELVTYYPSSATTGDLHVTSLTVGTDYNGVTPPDGVAAIYDKLWIGQGYTNPDRDPAALRVVGYPGALDKVLFLPGAGGGTLNVGIGTANPAVKLDIVGPPVALINGTRPLLYTAQIISGTDVEPVASGYGVLQLFRPITGRGGMAAIGGIYNGTNKDNDTGLAFYTNSETNSQILERVRITSAGNVGIGTTTPGATLYVNGGVDRPMAFFTGRRLRGPTDPVPDSSSYVFLQDLDSARAWGLRVGDAGDFAIHQVGVGDRLTILQNGRVGIGTTNPEATLEVQGTMKVFGARQVLRQNTVYQAATDGFVVAWGSGLCYYRIYSDSRNPPTTVVIESEGQTANAARATATVPIRKGDYWKVEKIQNVGDVQVSWTPLGN